MRQIIAMGGGGFSMEPGNLALDRYILSCAAKDSPRVCFVPTASGDADGNTLNFYKAFSTLSCVPSYLSLFNLPSADLECYVMDKDVIYVGGGNTRSLLALWREWGLDGIFRRAYEAGVVLAGISAGANCWFEQCTTDSIPGQISVLNCTGLLPGSFTPHYDGEAERRPALSRLLLDNKILPGLAADNSAAAHFIDGALVKAVSSRPGAQVYRVSLDEGRVVEEKIAMESV
jgi:dipeptidase E